MIVLVSCVLFMAAAINEPLEHDPAAKLIVSVLPAKTLRSKLLFDHEFVVAIANKSAVGLVVSVHHEDVRLELRRGDGSVFSPLDPYAPAVEFRKRVPADVRSIPAGRTIHVRIPAYVLRTPPPGRYRLRPFLIYPRERSYGGAEERSLSSARRRLGRSVIPGESTSIEVR